MPSLLDPNDELVTPEERKQILQQNLFGGLLQGGLQLLAAGDNLYPWQRAQMLGQVGQTIGAMPGNIREGMQNAAQQKLLQQKYAEKKQQDAFLKSEEFQNAVANMTPEYQALAKIAPVQAFTNWRQHQVEEKRAQMMAEKEDARFRQQMLLEDRRDARAAAKDAAQPTPAQKAVDTNYAKEYVEWGPGGGYAETQKQIGQLQGALNKLNAKDAYISGVVPGIVDKVGLGSYLMPEAATVKQDVENAVQSNLRAVLGGQFTEREGTALLRRTYDPALSEQQNAERVQRLLNQIQTAAAAKQDAANYYEKNGTLRGWTGKLPKMSDFDPDAKPNAGGNGGAGAGGGNADAGSPPVSALKEGVVTTFGNGQKWTVQGGRPVRVQ